MEIPVIADKFGQSIIYALFCTVGSQKPVNIPPLLTRQDKVRLFIRWERCVQSVVSSTGEISWAEMEHFLKPPCLLCIASRNLSILLELSS